MDKQQIRGAGEATAPDPRREMPELSVRSLRSQAAEAIKAAILSGALEPGRVYSAVALAGELGVSATPVREAMHAFVNAGLMETVRNRGFRMPALSAQALDNACEMRLLIEVPVTAKVARMNPRPSVAHLREFADQATVESNLGHAAAFLEADSHFHLGLMALADNELLTETVERIRERSRLYAVPGLGARTPIEIGANEHHLILDAVERGDVEECERLTRQHILRTRTAWSEPAG